MSRLFASNWRGVVLSAIAVAAIAISPGRATAQTNLVGNGSFETPQISGSLQTLPPGSTALSPWVISSDSLDVIKYPVATGLQAIHLNGTPTGSISQQLNTQVNQSYTLHFQYAAPPGGGSAPKTLTVQWSPPGRPDIHRNLLGFRQ